MERIPRYYEASETESVRFRCVWECVRCWPGGAIVPGGTDATHGAQENESDLEARLSTRVRKLLALKQAIEERAQTVSDQCSELQAELTEMKAASPGGAHQLVSADAAAAMQTTSHQIQQLSEVHAGLVEMKEQVIAELRRYRASKRFVVGWYSPAFPGS